jgi:hypothetical protein
MTLLKLYGKGAGVAQAVAELLLTENWSGIRFNGRNECTVESRKYYLQFDWDSNNSYRKMLYNGTLKNKQSGNALSWSYEQPNYLTFLKVIKWVKIARRNYLFNSVIT